MGRSLVINIPSLARASFLVRATERDQEAVPGFQEQSQRFWCISKALGCPPLPIAKGFPSPPWQCRLPTGEGKNCSFLYKSGRIEGKGKGRGNRQNRTGQKNKPQPLQRSGTESVPVFGLVCSGIRGFEHLELLFCHHKCYRDKNNMAFCWDE